MSIEDFFDHTCSIYHLEKNKTEFGYGIAPIESSAYGDEPAITGQFCHFHVKSDGTRLVQEDPYSAIEGTIKLSLPAGTDIRINDKVVWDGPGLSYRAGLPRQIRGHHVTATLYRLDGHKGAI